MFICLLVYKSREARPAAETPAETHEAEQPPRPAAGVHARGANKGYISLDRSREDGLPGRLCPGSVVSRFSGSGFADACPLWTTATIEPPISPLVTSARVLYPLWDHDAPRPCYAGNALPREQDK